MKRNKRKTNRYHCQVPVECKKGSAFDCSQTIDVSKGGAGFISENFVPVDTRFAVELNFTPNGESDLAIAQVRWVEQLPGGEGYRLGLRFVDIASRVKAQLAKHFGR